MEDIHEIVSELDRDGVVEPQLLPQRVDLGGVVLFTQHGRDRIAGISRVAAKVKVMTTNSVGMSCSRRFRITFCMVVLPFVLNYGLPAGILIKEAA